MAATAPQPPCRSDKSTPRAYGRQINICSSPPLHTDRLGCKVRRVGIRRRRNRVAKSGKVEEGEEANWMIVGTYSVRLVAPKIAGKLN